ncbi:hypothetical protein [Streptomyces sp. cmx-4-9]|uniref:hypothetical protein n=1 Tax=Streptomyces sp. cmx-4-9 TaxID=2790941 RepID=UPI00397F6ACC
MSDTETAETPETAPETAPSGPDEVQQAVLGGLMAVIGAPDDRETARTADAALHQLDQKLREH